MKRPEPNSILWIRTTNRKKSSDRHPLPPDVTEDHLISKADKIKLDEVRLSERKVGFRYGDVVALIERSKAA